ncbi:hypothetical protein BC629DRAFT_1441977 [Irpex lacteus]|nr:hypothetical protein BC629DRAFT_1441977 [Irpex lacteus]
MNVLRDCVERKSAVKVLMGYWESDNAAETMSDGEYELQLFRTGTWPFMSIALLRDLGKSHELLDDLEAVFWTFLYASLHQFKHTGTFDMEIFTYYNTPSGRARSRMLKSAALPRMGQTFEFDCSPLHTLIKDLSRGWRDYYRAVDDLCGLEGDLSSHLNAVETESDVEEDLRSSVEAARANFNTLCAKLSNPSYWHDCFSRALRAKGWKNDSSKEVLYPVRIEEKGLSTGDSGDTSNDSNVDEAFVPTPQIDGQTGIPTLNAHTPAASASLPAGLCISHSSGSFLPSSSKRTHEGPDGSGGSSRLSKRYRLAPGPESFPPSRAPSGKNETYGRPHHKFFQRRE